MFGLWRIQKFITRRQWIRNEKRKKADALKSVNEFPRVREVRRHNLDARLVVSLTSYPPRFPTLEKSLKSLLDQSIAPDEVILWIAENDLLQLPKEVKALTGFGLSIKTCPDLKSYKKIIPALAEFPSDYIVIADDDLFYSSVWLEKLVDTHAANPGKIICHRAHLAKFYQDGRLKPYHEWVSHTHRTCDDEDGWLFPTGGAGTLYPPSSLDTMTSDVTLFQELCPTADDIWLFWMARKAGSHVVKCSDHFDLICFDGSQNVGLKHVNVGQFQNDKQIENMQNKFGSIRQIFESSGDAGVSLKHVKEVA